MLDNVRAPAKGRIFQLDKGPYTLFFLVKSPTINNRTIAPTTEVSKLPNMFVLAIHN